MSGFNQGDTTIPVQFTRQQWEHVMVMLGRQPFEQVAQVILDIQRQMQMVELRRRNPPRDPPPPASSTPPPIPPADYGPIPPTKKDSEPE